MKRVALVFVFCLGILLTSAWLVMHPADAMSMTVTCRDGTSRTCGGTSCNGADFIPGGVNGYCQCSGRIAGMASNQSCDQPPQ
jgi:hypothetical protein